MKNITLAIEEEVLAAVRKQAAARNTTVNALVRDYLKQLATEDERLAQARENLLKLSEDTTWDPGQSWTWNRSDTYDRGVFSGHEHSSVFGLQEPATPYKKDDGE